MSKKNRVMKLDLGYWQGEPLTKKIKERFKQFLRSKENSKKVFKIAERIDWIDLGNFCLDQINELIKKIQIPESFEGLNLSTWYNRQYSKNILDYLEIELFDNLFHYLIRIDDSIGESRLDRIIKRAIEDCKSRIKYTIWILEYQAESSSLKWMKDPKTIKNKQVELEYFASVGRIFRRGKQNKPEEVKAFNKIDEIYEQSKQEGMKKSLRTISFYIARIDLELHQEHEQLLFYNRYLEYRKKNKNKLSG